MSSENSKDWKTFKENQEAQVEEIDDSLENLTPQNPVENKEADDLSVLEEKLALAEKKAQENWEKAVRAVAELENVRRRADKEIANAHRYGLEKIISSLLPVFDSLEQALQLVDPENQASMFEGLQLTMKLLTDVLEKFDAKQINPQGELFNPQEHEAMSIQESADAVPNSIVTVFQKGYKLNDRVIRPARVIVARAKTIDENA